MSVSKKTTVYHLSYGNPKCDVKIIDSHEGLTHIEGGGQRVTLDIKQLDWAIKALIEIEAERDEQ